MDDVDVRAALVAAGMLLDRFRLQGQPFPGWLVQHRNRLLYQRGAAGGTGRGAGHVCMVHAESVDTDTAAELLGRSPRWVRRHAKELGGVKVSRAWWFEPDTVLEHERGAT